MNYLRKTAIGAQALTFGAGKNGSSFLQVPTEAPVAACPSTVHAKDVSSFVQDAILANKSQIKGQPHAMFMVGGPGSGKSVVRDMCLERLGFRAQEEKDNFVVADPDKFMENLFGNNNTCYWENGFQERAKQDEGKPIEKRTHPFDVALANNYLVNEVLKQAKFNWVFDSTGRNLEFYSQKMDEMKKAGFRVSLCMVDVEPEIAVQRAEKRQKESGRSVDLDYLEQTYRTISTIIPQYQKFVEQGKVEAAMSYDNSGGKPVPMMKSEEDLEEERREFGPAKVEKLQKKTIEPMGSMYRKMIIAIALIAMTVAVVLLIAISGSSGADAESEDM